MSCGHPECAKAARLQAQLEKAKTEGLAAAVKNKWDRVVITMRTVNESYGYRDPKKKNTSDKIVDVETLVV